VKDLSNHSWGTAIDLNATWNGRGAIPAMMGDRGCIRELVAVAHANGFYWGGHFTTKDGMHFEVAAETL
jgi:D-alanyl-D-alanine carboxypeptidase